MASDGSIRIDVEVDSRTVVRAGDDLKKLETSAVQAGQGVEKSTTGFKNLATSLGLVAIAAKAMDVLKSAIGGAISRFDTLNAFPTVMERMGFSSESAQKSINKLSDGIQGLPTTLDGIVSSTQRIAVLTGDLDMATDTALALNNAFLASGASAGDAERGLTQYVQMLSKGSVDIMSWRTLQETMGYALKETAKEFGFTGASAQNDLYAALKSGDIVFSDFNAKLIELNEGVGGFADMAASGSAGIATSLGNLKNAVTVGIANIIGSFDRLAQATTGKNIAQNLDSLKVVVGSAFKFMGSVIEGAAPVVIVFVSAVQAAIPVVQALTPAIIGLVAAYAAYTVISKAQAAITAANTAIAAARATTMALTLATNARVAAQITATTVDRAGAAATVAQTSAITLSTFAIGVLTGTISLKTAATIVATTASYAFGAAIRFLLGPVGLIITAVGLLVAGVVGIVKWFNAATEEGERMGAKTEELATATDNLKTSVEDNALAYEKNQGHIETNAQAYSELAARAEELAAKEKLTGEEKKELAGYIEQLNQNVDGLNLAYGEEANALSASSEQIQNRVNLMMEEEKLHAAQERLTEVMKEQIEIQKQLEEINLLREEWGQKLEDGTVKSKEHKTALEELQLQEDSLKEANKLAGEERVAIDQQIIESSAAVAAAAEQDVGRQKLMLDELSETQKTTVESMKSSWEDYAAAATDMFDTLTDKSELSVSEMTANLEENQRIIGEWAENIATLAERGVDEGLLETLRAAGPESAGHVNALVNASDAELERLSTAFSEGGDVATDALSKSLGIEDSGVLDAVGHLVVGMESSLKSDIAAADFPGIGGDVTSGFASGIDEGIKDATNSSKKMADETTKAAKAALDSHSPSRVFKAIGGDVTDGLALGINDGTAKVIQAIQKMFQSVQNESSKNFGDITRNYDDAIKQIEKSLDKLPVVTQKAMKNVLDKLKESGRLQIETMKKLARDYDAEIKKIEKSLDKLPGIAQKSMSQMLERLKTGAPQQVSVMKTLSKDLLSPFNNTPAQFSQIGREAMSGMNSGLRAGQGAVLSTARALANSVARTMRSALQIHSPSRVTRKIGNETGEGVNLGLKDKQSAVNATSKKMADTIAGIIKQMNKDVRDDTAKHNTEIKTIEKRSKEDISSIQAKASKAKRALTKDETVRIRRITEDANKKIVTIEEKMAQEREKIAQESSKLLIQIAEKYVKDKTAAGKMNLKEEGHFWNEMKRASKVGSEEYEKALQNHQSVVKQMRSEMEKTNEDYTKRIVEIDKKLVDDTQKLNDEYNQAYSNRVSSLVNFVGLLDEYAEKEEVSGQKLIDNLRSQVTALTQYTAVISSLGTRIDNDALFEELQALGPKSLAELKALNSLSNSELQEFSSLYETRFRLARSQASRELEPLKDDITQQIKKLNYESQKELEVVNREWTDAIKKIVLGTKKEFDSMHQVGLDAIKGLEKGMLANESSLMSTAKRIANSIQSTIKSALDIHSPSRLMRDDIGKMIPAGIALGIDENAKAVYEALNSLSSGMDVWATPEVALGTGSMVRNAKSATPYRNDRQYATEAASPKPRTGDKLVIENVIMVDSQEMGRAMSDAVGMDQAGKMSIQSIVKGG
ncbi:tape measure protein [Planomicrobium sp. YIM 101495]|uniref:tape measure protein n=1 Tax=Planomicrobium sp. YIM 101495 TaxID=2665160 RepID=UPI0012B7E320|nr:tape measure protein [Planomicrobium sp. YIM 101495]MTD30156.1 tape measure protein [Planomicrobium sp. YIM 101495]